MPIIGRGFDMSVVSQPIDTERRRSTTTHSCQVKCQESSSQARRGVGAFQRSPNSPVVASSGTRATVSWMTLGGHASIVPYRETWRRNQRTVRAMWRQLRLQKGTDSNGLVKNSESQLTQLITMTFALESSFMRGLIALRSRTLTADGRRALPTPRS
jgi:hypothetical protein